jgi:hypothetical protein
MESIKQTLANVQNAISGDKNDQHDKATHDQHHEQHHEHSTGDQPTQAMPAADQSSRTTEGGAHDGITQSDSAGTAGSNSNLPDDLEKTLSGPKDPAVQGEEHPKMTGEGAPGSHSALFGLTPDGKKA